MNIHLLYGYILKSLHLDYIIWFYRIPMVFGFLELNIYYCNNIELMISHAIFIIPTIPLPV